MKINHIELCEVERLAIEKLCNSTGLPFEVLLLACARYLAESHVVMASPFKDLNRLGVDIMAERIKKIHCATTSPD